MYLDDLVSRSAREQLEKLAPQLLAEAAKQGQAFVVATLQEAQRTGSIDLQQIAASINLTLPSGEEVKLASAKSRSLRTLLQGLAFDVILGIVVIVGPIVAGLDLSTGAGWAILGGSIAKSILTSVASYVMRLKVTPKYDKTAS